MINTLFYFANSEAEYLAHKQEIAPYTIVLCKEENTIWRNGERYGGDGSVVRIDPNESTISYAINDSSTEHPTNENDWVSERPAAEQGRYLWTRDITAYTDGTHTITYGVVYFPLDGAGTEIDRNNTFIKYSTQKTQQRPPVSTFTLNEPPALEIGDWLWVLNRVTYEGGTPLDSYSVSRVGSDGAQGDPGADGYTTHFAYSTSANGVENFSTTNFIGALYIGTCRDNQANDPGYDAQTPEEIVAAAAHYVWTKWKGDDGSTQYIHIKYSNDAGRTFTANNGETPGYYMGQCVDNNVAAPLNISLYKWALIKGEDGKEGTGINILGAFDSVAELNALDVSGLNAGDAYMVASDLYVWTGSEWKNVGRIKGEPGNNQYIHVAWSTSADGSENFAVVKQAGIAYTYMGICVDSESDDPQTYESYIWTLVKGDKGDKGDQGEQGPKGEDGLNGKDGVDGAPGTSTYFHVAYANKNTSGGIVDFSLDDPTDREYIGTYVDSTYADSTSPAAYTWMLAKGAQGATGEQGIPGQNGADGKTSYLHIKYSNDGQTFTANNGETPGYYLGQYVDFTQADSTVFSKYKWVLIKGTDGTDGKDGTGINIKGAVASASQLPATGDNPGDAYMVDKDLYVWTGTTWKNVGQIKGDDGRDGTNGMDGKSAYLHIAYATSSNGTNFSTTHFSGATYIGMYTDSYVEDSEDWQDYVWSLIKGEKGDKGDKGDDGLNGKDGLPGAPGTSSYFHVAYANKTAGGTIVDFSVDNPEGREYIGTYVDQTQADSTNPSKYTWMLAKGAQGENGEDGIPGQDGEDGKTSYLHIKYSNDAGSTFTANNGETPGYYLGQYVDFTQADSSDPSKYKWALIKGVDGTDGKDGTGVNIKGSVDSASQLPSSGVSAGDAYMVGKDLYIWTGSQWKNVGQIKGNDGKDGTNGINGTSAYLHIAYATSADGTQGFSTTSFTGATYIGICTDSAQADPETPSSYVWSLFKGEKGDKGDSITINTTASKVEYAIGNSGTVAPNAGWSTTVPSAQQGKYLWTRDTTVYSDGKSTVTYGVSYYGTDGANGTNGTSVTINSAQTFVRYSTQKTSSQPAVSTFSLTQPPTLSQGDYLWILSRVTYSDGTVLDSYSVSRVGTDGDEGDPGSDGYTTHFAYSTSANGLQNFSTTNFDGATYIGTYRDLNSADSLTYTDYTWTRWKGDKGADGDVFAYIDENGLVLKSGSGDNLTEFNLSTAGLLQVRNAIVYGELYSSKGTIGGLTLSNNSLRNGMTSLDDTTNNGVWLGTTGIALGKGAFKVTNAGVLTAKSGTVGGWTIGENQLNSGSGASYVALNSAASNTNAYAMWAGNSDAASAPFSVTKAGALKATNANISGSITASSITLTGTATIPAAKISGTITTNTLEASKSFTAGGIALASHTKLDGDGLDIYITRDGISGESHMIRMNADGSGYLAASNISWDGNGGFNLTSGSSGRYIRYNPTDGYLDAVISSLEVGSGVIIGGDTAINGELSASDATIGSIETAGNVSIGGNLEVSGTISGSFEALSGGSLAIKSGNTTNASITSAGAITAKGLTVYGTSTFRSAISGSTSVGTISGMGVFTSSSEEITFDGAITNTGSLSSSGLTVKQGNTTTISTTSGGAITAAGKIKGDSLEATYLSVAKSGNTAKLSIDSSGNIELVGSVTSGSSVGNSIWPTVTRDTTASTITKGRVYAITLGDLKTMINNTDNTYSTKYSNWSVMLTRTI